MISQIEDFSVNEFDNKTQEGTTPEQPKDNLTN